MSETMKKRFRWGGIPLLLVLGIGLDLADTSREDPARGFALVGAVSSAIQPGTSVVGLITSGSGQLDQPVPRDARLTEAQVENMVRYAVAMAGGLQIYLEPQAEWVVIKPNVVEVKERGSGVITDWRVVKALVKIVHEIAPEAHITIAEGPGGWVSPENADSVARGIGIRVGDGFGVAGYRDLLQDPELAGMDLDLVDLNFDPAREVAVPDGGYARDHYFIPNTILECDFLIDVPVLKVIGSVGMTNAMKNFIGLAPGLKYGWSKMSGYPPGSGTPGIPHTVGVLDETIVDLTALSGVDFTVVDAIVGMERAKTDRDDGRPVRLNTILAGADIVATDAVSAWLIGFNPFDIEYLTLGAYKGLGQCDPNQIQIKGSSIAEVAIRFEKYPGDAGRNGEYGHFGQGGRTWLLKGPFDRSQAQGTAEFIDVRTPGPRPGQNGWSQPVYFHDDKIDLDKYYDDPFDCLVYGYAEFQAEKEQEAELWVGSDEGLRVWINGAKVYDHEGRRRHRLPNDRPMIPIREGSNTVLVRASQTRGRFDFSLNICAPETDPRYDGNRVWGLKFTVPASPTPEDAVLTELAADSEEQRIPPGAKVLEGARFVRHFDTLIGSLEGCLLSLGGELSPPRLIGQTGHAFRICVSDSLDLRGPTMLDLQSMVTLYEGLGYEVRYIHGREEDPDFVDRQQEAWEAIRASIDRGTPVVGRFGSFFWMINGYHPQQEEYYISAFMPSLEEPVGLFELGRMERTGGVEYGALEVLILGRRKSVDPAAAVRGALQFAVAEARRHTEPGNGYCRGFKAFEHWLEEIERGRVSHRGLGPALTAGVVMERRSYARPYLQEIAADVPGDVAARLQEAGRCYAEEVAYLGKVAARFPLMGSGEPIDLEDPVQRKEVVALLQEAYKWECRAVEQLEEALAMLP